MLRREVPILVSFLILLNSCSMAPKLPGGTTVIYSVTKSSQEFSGKEEYSTRELEKLLVEESESGRIWLDQNGQRFRERSHLPTAVYYPVQDKIIPFEVELDFSSLYPLEVGKTITRKEPWKDFQDYIFHRLFGRMEERCEVVGKEQITVPLGSFEAFRVICSQNSLMSSSHDTGSMRGIFSGSMSTFYLSPEVPVFLRRVDNHSWQLSSGYETWELKSLHIPGNEKKETDFSDE